MLSGTDFSAYDEILFIGKSIGTAAAAQIAAETSQPVRLLLYTPLEETFLFPLKDCIVFTGLADPWVGGDSSRIPQLCEERGIPCFVYEGANHSLETGEVQKDLQNLQEIMGETKHFILGSRTL
jgi:phosphoglycolate phosphatase